MTGHHIAGNADQHGVDATFAFVDLAGFTAVTEAHGDTHALAIVRAFRQRTLAVLEPGDQLVKTIGDAVMLAFRTPQAAITALRRLIETELCDHDAVLFPRGGAHHGPAVADGDDFYGATVNLAARVAAEAAPGQLLVTTQAALAARDCGAVVTHVGAVELRNVAEPVDLYDVQVASGGRDVGIDPVCKMRVPTQGAAAVTLDWAGSAHHFCGLPCLSRFAADPFAFLPG